MTFKVALRGTGWYVLCLGFFGVTLLFDSASRLKGLLVLGGACVIVVYQCLKSRRVEWLTAHGTRVSADVVRVERVFSEPDDEGESTCLGWRVVAEWRDPATQRKVSFASRDGLDVFDPLSKRRPLCVDVYLKPGDSQTYHVDISTLREKRPRPE